MYSFYYCSGSLERAFFKSCSLLWGLEAFYLLIKLSKVEHEQAIYAKHLQTPSKIKKAKLHTRWEQECKKKHSKTKKTAHPIGASLLFDSLAMGVADLCFFWGGCVDSGHLEAKMQKTFKEEKNCTLLPFTSSGFRHSIVPIFFLWCFGCSSLEVWLVLFEPGISI